MRLRRPAALLTATALAIGGVLVTAAPAQAAPFEVNSTADTLTEGTLRWAITEAEANGAEADTISFAETLDGQTITLATALPVITKALTIDAGGVDVTIARSGAFPIFEARADTDDADFTVFDLTLSAAGAGSAGNAVLVLPASLVTEVDATFAGVDISGFFDAGESGAIQAVGVASLTIRDSVFDDNSTQNPLGGGAVSAANVSGDVVISGSSFTGNTASGDGGAVTLTEIAGVEITDSTFDDNGAEGSGGAVSIDSETLSILPSVAITGSTFLRNVAGGGGGAVNAYYTESLSVTDSAFQDNTADLDGGAVFFAYVSDPTLTRVQFAGNESLTDGGAIAFAQISGIFTAAQSSFTDNIARGAGGAIFAQVPDGPIDILGSTFARNFAEFQGGALGLGNPDSDDDSAVFDDVRILDSTFTGNESNRVGGAVWVDDLFANLIVERTSFTDNVFAQIGGGVYVGIVQEDALLRIDSSTFTGAFGEGSAFGHAFAVEEVLGEVELVNSTIDELLGATDLASVIAFDNIFGALDIRHSTIRGALALSMEALATEDATIANSIVQATQADEAISIANIADDGTTLGLSWSIIDTPIGPEVTDAGGNRLDTDPQLGALAANGGPTLTRLPQPGSPAINSGQNPPPAATPDFDQRGSGFPRVVDGRLDIGAVEVTPTLPATGSEFPWTAVVLSALVLALGATGLVARARHRVV